MIITNKIAKLIITLLPGKQFKEIIKLTKKLYFKKSLKNFMLNFMLINSI